MDSPTETHTLRPRVAHFAGRLGANQADILDPSDKDNASALQRVPDAAPVLDLRSLLSLRQFFEPDLWRSALGEFCG